MADGWTDENWVKRRASMADQMWGVRPSGSQYSALEGLLSGIGSGLGNLSVKDSLDTNQQLRQDAIKGAAAQKDSKSLGRYLLSSGVPPLADQGLGVLSGGMEKAEDRAASFEQQKKLFEFQKKLAMDMKKAEMQQTMEMLRTMGALPPAQAPGAAPSAPGSMPSVPGISVSPQSAAPPVAGPSEPPNPNAGFADTLLETPQHRTPSPAQKAGIALVLGEKGKAVDALMEKGDKPTESQTKDASYAERMLRAEAGLREVVPTDDAGKFLKYDPTSSMFRFLPDWNVTNSTEWQQYNRNAREGIAAILRKDTGAAVSDTEWAWYFPMYYPQPGDSAQVVKDKQDARISVARGLRNGSGGAFDQMFPKFNEQLRTRLLKSGADLTPKAPPPSATAAGAPPSTHTQIMRNPKTGQMVGYNPQTGKWEPIAQVSAPSLGEMVSP